MENLEIIEYGSKSCVKCKILDRTLKNVSLPSELKKVYMEDDKEAFEKEGITNLPTLVIKNGDKKEVLNGPILPKQILEAIKNVRF